MAKIQVDFTHLHGIVTNAVINFFISLQKTVDK